MLLTHGAGRVAATALALAAMACSSPSDGGRSTGKHPVGTVAANVVVGRRPFGIAVTSVSSTLNRTLFHARFTLTEVSRISRSHQTVESFMLLMNSQV